MKTLLLIAALTSTIAFANNAKTNQNTDALKNAIKTINASEKLITNETKETIGENKGTDILAIDQATLNINDSSNKTKSL